MNLDQVPGLDPDVFIRAVAVLPLGANDVVDLLFHGSIAMGANT